MGSSCSTPPLNVVFTGNFSFPDGMAGCTRIQHAIRCIQDENHSCRVLLFRRQTEDHATDVTKGRFRGSPYTRVGAPFKKDATLPVQAAICYYRLTRFLRRFYRPGAKNVIYHYKGPDIENVALLAWARRLGYRVVFDVTEDVEHLRRRPKNLLERIKMASARWLQGRIGAIADGVLTVSRHLRDKLQQHVRNRVPVRLRGISVDVDRFRTPPTPFHDPVRLLYSGSFALKDGVENLLEAFDRLAGTHNLELTLTGTAEPDRLAEIRDRIRNMRHGDRVERTGFLPENEYIQSIRQCDIACMTRIDTPYARGGFPFKLGEYLAAGKPVVASNVAGIDRHLEHRSDAYLIEPGSVDAIVEGLRFLLEHSDRAQAMGERARETARRQFSVRAQRSLLRDFLNTI